MKQAKYFILTAQDLQGCKQKYAIRHIDRIFVVCYIKSSGFKLVDLIEQRWHMAKRIAGVTEKLLECAKEEFMRNGYENASLRVIAEKAGSSKGAIIFATRTKRACTIPLYSLPWMIFVA